MSVGFSGMKVYSAIILGYHLIYLLMVYLIKVEQQGETEGEIIHLLGWLLLLLTLAHEQGAGLELQDVIVTLQAAT